jgi:hypothetical protein
MAAMNHFGPRTAWEARRAWRRLGAAATAGIAALLCAAAMLWHAHMLEQQMPALHARLQTARQAAATPAAAPPTAADGLAAFYRHLPAHAAIPEQLQKLVEIADRHRVPLAKAEYKPQREPRAGFLRYQINLPVKADYAAVQAFMLEALQALPALTLDSVAFKRERSDTADVEARIQFVLLVRTAEGQS